MPDSSPIRIDVRQVLRQRLGRYYKYVPGWLQGRLERLIHQDEMNALLGNSHPAEGAEFCRAILSELDVELSVDPASVMPPRDNKRVIIVSNHPLGGLDGMALIDFFTEYYGTEVRFVVNDLLMAVAPLKPVFLPINKHGGQSRGSLTQLEEAFAGDYPIIIFPAGLVSRRGKGGHVADLEWKKMFVVKAIEYGRDIVPMHFNGHNSGRFYRTANMRKQLGIKFNFEMLLLPDELFRARGSRFSITIGQTISCDQLKGGSGAKAQAEAIRNVVYAMSANHETTK